MRIALDTDRVSVIHGDSRLVLPALADKSFDIVCTDPPYSPHTHAKLGKERAADGRQIHRKELEFPPIDDIQIAELAEHFVRLSRGWIVVFSDFRQSGVWGRAVERAGGAWIRTGAWVKTNPMPQLTGDRPSVGHEDIVIGHATGRNMSWNAKGRPSTWRGRRDAGYGEDPHPNQKPAWLLQSLLGMFCPPGGLCLDPFFGSGTTAIGAFATERLEGESPAETTCPKCVKKLLEQYQPPLPDGVRVVGVEGDQKWIDLAISRIHENTAALTAA
jgi:site-specific DNA-methyltransferase (adenine-specific)